MKAIWVALALPLSGWSELPPWREIPAVSRPSRVEPARWPFVVLPGGAVAYLFSPSKAGKAVLNMRFHYSARADSARLPAISNLNIGFGLSFGY